MHRIIVVVFSVLLLQPLYKAQVASGLVARYFFNSATTNDDIGTNHLTAFNGATFGTDRFGNNNKSVLLDGTNDYLRSTNPFFNPAQPFTISLWFKTLNPDQTRQTFFNSSPHTIVVTGYNWYGDGTYDVGMSSNGSYWDRCSTAPNLLDTFLVAGSTPTVWNHFVMSYNGTIFKYYLNGLNVNTCTSGAPLAGTIDLFFGAISLGPDQYFNGYLDDIGIYNRALEQNEIELLFHEVNPFTTGLNDYQGTQQIQIFPNPTNENIYLSEKADLSIYDVKGQIVFSGTDVQFVNFTTFSKGLYLAVIRTTNGQVVCAKIIKE